MTRSRVSGSRLSSTRPLSTRETVEAWTLAAFATSVIVTRRAAKPPPPRGNRLFSTIRRKPAAGCALAVDLFSQAIGREDVDMATRDPDQPAVLEIGQHFVHRH